MIIIQRLVIKIFSYFSLIEFFKVIFGKFIVETQYA